MGASRDDFIKYPRTPHLFGSKGTDDDKHLGRDESEAFIGDPSLIVEEKLDGTNVGIHFTSAGRMVLQCRGHEITEGSGGRGAPEVSGAPMWLAMLGFGVAVGLATQHDAKQPVNQSPAAVCTAHRDIGDNAHVSFTDDLHELHHGVTL